MRKGMQLIVDGTDPDLLREILDAEIDAMAARHKIGLVGLREGRRLAPTIGVLGTVVVAGPRARQPERARDARPGDLRRVHRDAATASARRTSSTCPSATRCRC